jgi:predicted O-methyltransferase YrrM
MWPKLTRRRVLGGCLLLSGALFIGFGIWQQSEPLLIVGVAWWIAALVGLGVLIVQRINAVMHLSALNRSDFQQLNAGNSKAVWLLRESLKQTTQLSIQLSALQDAQAERLKRQATELDRLSANLNILCNQLTSDESIAQTWRHDHSEQVMTFRRQFADFVESVAEWMAIAEADAKQGVADLVAGEAAAIQSGVETLLQHFEHVDGVLSTVHGLAQQVPGAIVANGEQIDSMSRSLQAVLSGLRGSEREALLEGLLHRIDGVDSRLSSIQEATEQGFSNELVEAISQTVKVILADAGSTERESILKAVRGRLDAINDAVAAMQQASRQMNEATAAESEQIKAISKSVKSILPAQRTEIARAKVESVKEVEAILQLQAFLTPDKPMPLLGGWAMEPVSMLGVVTELVARQPELVLECGSGTSTLWIAKALKRMGKGRLVSLEHLEDHHDATSRALLAAGLDSWVDLRLAPLRTNRIGVEQFEWYDLSRVEILEGSVELLLVDGPPQATGPLARYPALPLLERFLADQALVILDDANRPEEIEGVNRWLKEYPGFQEIRGLGERTKMFTYSKPISGSSERRKNSVHLQAL